jgi:hypothetical protein
VPAVLYIIICQLLHHCAKKYDSLLLYYSAALSAHPSMHVSADMHVQRDIAEQNVQAGAALALA